MWQIRQQIDRLLQTASDHMTITSAVVFVGGILLIWVMCNGARK